MLTPKIFTCPACQYRARIIGCPQTTYHGRTTTIHCHDCRTLNDVWLWTGSTPPKGPEPAPHCRRDYSHTVTPWTTGGPCPRCSSPIPGPDPVLRTGVRISSRQRKE